MRRIVLVDANEIQNWTMLYGMGFNEIYELNALKTNPGQIANVLTIGNGDGVLTIGKEPFVFLQSMYHFGIRGENFADCSQIRRVSIEGGAFVMAMTEVPRTQPQLVRVQDFLSPSFTDHKVWNFKQKILHTYEEVDKFLNWIDNLPKDTPIGLDYEASGMPLDEWFELSGASIGTIQYGGFISFTDLRHNCDQATYQSILDRLGRILDERQSHCWVYNQQYEFQVSHRMLGVTLYDLCDASVFNTLDGFHMKKYSLKWTANRVLESTVWDTEFDRISDLIDQMLFLEVDKLKKDRQKVLRVSPETFDKTDEWKTLITRYPQYEQEFRSLILEYWGNPFMCIPSEILGYYCNLDMFYTLMIATEQSKYYSEDAINVFLGNNRLGALLHSSGLYIDEKLRTDYHNEGLKEMAWGITYCATARCMINMNKLRPSIANINRYTPIAQALLKANKFFNGDVLEITKHILLSNIDQADLYELGLDQGTLIGTYGVDFTKAFLNIVRDAMIEVKMIKTPRATKANPNPQPTIAMKIDASVERKRKILDIIAERLKPLLGLDKFKPGAKHQALETYLRYEGVYNDLVKVSSQQLNDRNNVPDEIYFQGKKFTLQEYSDYVSDNYFKCKSPIENNEICLELAKDYQAETAYLAAIFESTQQLNNGDKFYKTLGITNPDDAFVHFMNNWENYIKSGKQNLGDYPEKVYNLALKYYNDLGSDTVKKTWDNFNGYIAQEQFFPEVSSPEMCELYGNTFNPADLEDRMFFMRKFVINYLRYKKYAKVLAVYIDGMFKKNNIWVIEGKDHIPLRRARPDEPGAVEKCMVHYDVNTKVTKRWSSGFHTIISHADLKDCIITPPAYYTDPKTGEVIRDCDYILTYFDISSAEVLRNHCRLM